MNRPNASEVASLTTVLGWLHASILTLDEMPASVDFIVEANEAMNGIDRARLIVTKRIEHLYAKDAA